MGEAAAAALEAGGGGVAGPSASERAAEAARLHAADAHATSRSAVLWYALPERRVLPAARGQLLRGATVPGWLANPPPAKHAAQTYLLHHDNQPAAFPPPAAVELPRGAIIHTNKGDIWLKLFPDEVRLLLLCVFACLGLRS